VTHLTSEQLSAQLDHALTGRAAEQAELHLAACEECRGALATLAAQDASLRPALTHDPGEAYFERFADRVEDRIRAAGLAGAQARGQGFDLGRFFRSPRALAWTGAAAVVVVGAGLALMAGREVRPPDLRDRDLAERSQQVAPGSAKETEAIPPPETTTGEAAPPPATAGRERDAAAPLMQGGAAAESQLEAGRSGAPVAEGERAEPGRKDRPTAPARVATGQSVERQRASSPATPPLPGLASPGRAVEVRRNEMGEDVPVSRPGERQPAPRPSPAATGQVEQLRKKIAAEPLKDGKTLGAIRSRYSDAEKSESTSSSLSFASPPEGNQPVATATPLAAPPSSRMAEPTAGEGLAAGEGRLCGEVVDAAGRPVAGAQVSVADVGRTATTDARGAFCLGAPAGEHPLAVMAVGFSESRQAVLVGRDEAVVRVTLAAVSVLDERRGAMSRPAPLPRAQAKPPAEPRDGYAALPDTTRSIVRAAQQLQTSATARHSAGLFDAAAAGWERALRRLAGGPLELETRRQLAEARYHAWETAPNGRRASAAVEALTAYALRAPAGPERDQATRWLDRVRH
jgi:hypothetical protein